MTDTELMMIEQLTYRNITSGDKGKCLRDILNGCSESSPEIRYLKEKCNDPNSEFYNLVLSDTAVDEHNQTVALCFSNPEKPDEAIIAFRGTTDPSQDGGTEWADNFEGLNSYDTEKQQEALDFVERQPYNNITVTGHSKGGNKAMYVTIKSDKVTKCVSMDGQGFSKEFAEKYEGEIDQNAHKITNYSVDEDPVNALLFQLPGSNQVYCDGRNGGSVVAIHGSANFFVLDENGDIKVDENGYPIIVAPVERSDSSKMIHEFTIFVCNVASDEDKEKIVDFLAKLLTTDDKVQYFVDNIDSLPLILAYLAKYMDTYDISSEEVRNLINTLFGNIVIKGVDITDLIVQLVDGLKDNLTDGSQDPLIKALLYQIDGILRLIGYDCDLTSRWKEAEKKVKDIGPVDPEEGLQELQIREGKVRDFSVSKYNAIINVIDKIQSGSFDGLSAWDTYADEDWYASLLIGPLKRAINSYYDSLYQTNSTCKERVEKVFSDVENIDSIAKIKNFANIAQRNLVVSNLHRHATSIG